MGRSTNLRFSVVLAFALGYGVFIFAAAELETSSPIDYGKALLVSTVSGTLPLLAGWPLVRRSRSWPAFMLTGIAVGTLLAAFGFLLLWKFYVVPFFGPIPALPVVQRGLTSGPMIAATWVIERWWATRTTPTGAEA